MDKIKNIGKFIFQIVMSLYLLIEYFAFIFHKGHVTKKDMDQYFEDNGILSRIKFLIMPTRVRSEILKKKDVQHFPDFMKSMTIYSLLASLIIVGGFYLTELMLDTEKNTLYFLIKSDNYALVGLGIIWVFIIFLWSTSRILEISYAFFNDAHTHLEKPKDDRIETNLKYPDRIRLAMYSYIELILLFGSLYYVLSAINCSSYNIAGKETVIDIVNAIYFSGVTITTLGYGDISPNIFISKILVIFEVLSGFALIIVSFTVYVSRAMREMGLSDEVEIYKDKYNTLNDEYEKFKKDGKIEK